MRLTHILLILLLACTTTATAQRRKPAAAAKTTTQKSKAAKPTAPALDLHLYRSMIPATAKVMFIDSVVVPKSDFLAAIPLHDETGRMDYAKPSLARYGNSFSGRRITTVGDSTRTTLWMQSQLGNGWTRPEQLMDISEETYVAQNYPFLAADGVTLYFSAEGDESMGGRDIFMTSYNSDKTSWYEPQNMGLPFNSTANEYLLAIDDVDSLGWLVTDRRQPKDSVCIYTFVPTAVRKDFQEDDLTDKQIERYSRILAIRDTWQFGNRQAALRRRDAMLQRAKASAIKVSDYPTLVINDSRVVTDPAQLTNSESRSLYNQLKELITMLDTTRQHLDKLRQQYARSHSSSLATTILDEEKALRQQLADQKALTLRLCALEGVR